MLSLAIEIVCFGSPVDALPFLPVRPLWVQLLDRFFTGHSPTPPGVPSLASDATAAAATAAITADPNQQPAEPTMAQGELAPWHLVPSPSWVAAGAFRQGPVETPRGQGAKPSAHIRRGRKLFELLYNLPRWVLGPFLDLSAPRPSCLLVHTPWRAALPLSSPAAPDPSPHEAYLGHRSLQGLPRYAAGPVRRVSTPWRPPAPVGLQLAPALWRAPAPADLQRGPGPWRAPVPVVSRRHIAPAPAARRPAPRRVWPRVMPRRIYPAEFPEYRGPGPPRRRGQARPQQVRRRAPVAAAAPGPGRGGPGGRQASDATGAASSSATEASGLEEALILEEARQEASCPFQKEKDGGQGQSKFHLKEALPHLCSWALENCEMPDSTQRERQHELLHGNLFCRQGIG